MNPTSAARARTSQYPRLRSLLEYLDHLGKPADLDTLGRLLKELDITRADIEPACIFKDDRYQRTPIHDHKGAACGFLVVDGIATETRFERTPSGLIIPAWTKHHEPGYVCVSGEADIHQVANTQPKGRECVTLHCYTPQLRNFNVYSLDTPTASHPDTVRKFEAR
jgi:hypothetical protein